MAREGPRRREEEQQRDYRRREESAMKIRQIDWTRVFIPYEAPLGPYMGRTGPTEGASALIVRVETEDGRVGWGEGHGARLPDVSRLLRGQHVGDVERALELLD